MTGASLDPISDGRWPAFLRRCPDALVFHDPAWLRLLRDQYGYEFAAWCVLEGDEIVAGLPVAAVRSRLTGNRLVAVPFCDLCGPLVAAGAADGTRARLLGEIAERQAGAGLPLEIHAPVEGLAGAGASQRFLHHVVPLASDPAEVERRFTQSQVKRNARKAEKLGLRASRRTDAAALDAFYALHLGTRRHQGVPIQPRRFIRRFADLFEQGLGFVTLVGRDGEPPAAAAVFLRYAGTLTYKYGASDRARLAERPNNLLFLDAIRWACEEGLERFDLGRTDLDNPGLRDFKLSWGAAETELTYTRLPDHGGDGGRSGTPSIVRAVLRRSPRVVSRAIGEALYKHFA